MANKIILKENGLSSQPNAPTGYRYLGYDGSTISEKTGATVSGIGGGSSALVYRALLTQTSTNAPVLTVLENTIGSISSAYTSEGLYSITSSGLFTSDKTMVFIGGVNATSFIKAYWSTASSISISTKIFVFGDFNNLDGVLVKTPIEIIVYP